MYMVPPIKMWEKCEVNEKREKEKKNEVEIGK